MVFKILRKLGLENILESFNEFKYMLLIKRKNGPKPIRKFFINFELVQKKRFWEKNVKQLKKRSKKLAFSCKLAKYNQVKGISNEF